MVESLLDVEAVRRSRLQGKIEGKIEDLMKILQVKQFANDEIIARVAIEKDVERLSEWVIAAATATDFAEFKRVVIGRA